MGFRAKLVGIQGPGGALIPRELLVHWATQIPDVRREVIAKLQQDGYLGALGLEPVPWWRRIFRRRAELPAG